MRYVRITARMPAQAAEITPHIFRHTTATAALRRGMRIEQVQQLLGHASLDTTRIYAEIADEEVQAAHRKHVT